jgi:predicted PurR-regulated permease PerM
MQLNDTDLQQLKDLISEGQKATQKQIDTFNERFDNYQKATQWVVSLAFSLIVSATVITIVSAVFRR